MAQHTLAARRAPTYQPTRYQATRRRAAPQARRYRPDIQGLRAVAILVVALYHAGVPFLRGGYVGVDVFFVISGFLITRQLFDEAHVRGRINLVRFYANRFRRLLPPVVLVVATTVIVAHFVLPYGQLRSLAKDVYYTSFYGINYHFAAEGVQYQNATAPPSPLQHFWSLAVEEQFYLLWPLLIVVCAVIGRRRYRRGLTILVIATLTTATLWYSIRISGSQTSLAYFSLQTRAWELGFGALVALSANRWARLPRGLARLFGWTGLGAILVTAVTYSDKTVYPGVAAIVPVAGATLLIAAGVLRNSHTPETVLLQRPFMQYAGKVSYAWYLWHWPMLVLLPAWLGHPLNTWENVEIVCLAFWFAVLTYFLENASHRSTWSPRRWGQTGIALSLTILALSWGITASLPNLAGTGVARHSLALTSANVSTVQQAIDQSVGITNLPRNLTPTLAHAPGDVPPTGGTTPTLTGPLGGGRCLATLAMTVSAECVLGDPHATKTAVLIGDSHADQWATPLSRLALKNHWRIIEITKSACPFANLPVFSSDLKRDYRECYVFRANLKRQVAALTPSLIIASQSDTVESTSVPDSLWAKATVSALIALAGHTAKIAYIGDSPTTRTDVLPCLEQHVSNATACVYKRADAHSAFTPRYLKLGAALTKAGIGYVNVLNFFCNATVCPSVVDNMVVHRDSGHITNTYATWLQPMLTTIFTEASA